MKHFKILIIALLALFLSSASYAQVSKEVEAKIKKQIEEQWELALKLIQDLDAEACQKLFSKTDFKGDMIDGRVIRPKEKYFETLTKWFSNRKQQQIKPDLVDIRVLSPKFALLDYAGKVLIVNKEGSNTQFNHTMSFLYKKEPIGWRIIHMHESTPSN